MKRIFITYGDDNYEDAKRKIVQQATQTRQFDEILSFGKFDLTEELLHSSIIKEKKGGGLWSWKPDIIWQVMQHSNNGDVIIYCDAGCTLQETKEWQWYWKILMKYDILAQRITQRTDNWTRKEVLDYFSQNGKGWIKCYQYQATIALKISDFSRQFVEEWRRIMIDNPILVKDVSLDELSTQHPSFIENRHDQAVYSALIYKYLNNTERKNNIYSCWERIEDCSLLYKQAIRATRLRKGEKELRSKKCKRIIKRLIRHCFMIPFYYSLLQKWYSRY